MQNELEECSVCSRWTKLGDHFESGNRNPRTGETPTQNYICSWCQKAAANLRETREALDAWEKRRAA